MIEFVVANARVIKVEELTIAPVATVADPSASSPKIKLIASTLKVEPANADLDPRTQMHGLMTVPQELRFGMRYALLLREDDGALQTLGRHFKDE